ncbi:MerR family transcriptional regulator [Nocardia sp. NPDC019395]|uniref:MerR family transcriptional regulator n=1 Tax=Nocardia sp. NPDC019395 TaxID=3154686 RepID=UPI0033FB5B75
MALSTRQLADFAGTTVKAIRYYHEIGLLDMPERKPNGYKQYKISHLIRLMQIKRLSELGVPLSEIPATGQADEDPDEAIRRLDAELAARVEQINRVRAELALILRHRAPMHMPPEFAPISRDLSDAHQSLLMVYSAILSEEHMGEFLQMISAPDDTEADFDALPPDADEATIDRLAERMVPVVRRLQVEHPWSKDATANSPHGARLAANTVGHALVEFYNPAQLRVLQRLNTLLEQADDETPS